MGRKRKVARPEDCESRALLPPCRVCEGPAGGFHYGVNSCEACKGFFHRCTIGKEKLKSCTGDGKCPILYTMQKVCKMCRYNKCISVGMAKQAIKTGRYTVEKRTKDILELKTLEGKQSRSKESSRKIAGKKTHSSFDDPQGRIRQTEESDKPEHHSQDSNSVHPAFHGHSSTGRWRHSQYDCPHDNNMFCSPVVGCSLYRPTEVDYLSPSTSDHSRVSSSDFSPLFSDTPSNTGSADNSPCNPSCDRALSQCQCYPSIRELYSDIDTVTEILLKARKDYVEDLLPNKTSEEMDRKAEEHLETCRIRHEMFGPMPRLSDQDYDNIYATTGLDADNRMQYLACLCEQMELIIRAYAKFAKKVPGFSYLETHDQVTLIKYSHSEFMHFMGFNAVSQGVIEYSDLRLRCKRCLGMEELADLTDFFLIHTNTIKELEITLEERVLMVAIALMAPDREHIVKSEKVRLIYELLNECLIKLFSRRSARPLQMYAKITNIMVGYRTLNQMIEEFFRTAGLAKYSNVLDNPLLREVFGGIFYCDFDSDNL